MFTQRLVQIQLPGAFVSESDAWIEFRDGNRIFYADPFMVRGGDGKPITYLDFYRGNLILQDLGLRKPTDREYNLMLKNPVIANEMKTNTIWTGFVKNVKKNGERFTGLYIERPEVRGNNYDDFQVVGSEKRVDLPPTGWFKISELLQSETGFPEKTWPWPSYPYPWTAGEKQDEPFAFFSIYEGDVDIIRGPVLIALCARYAKDWVYDVTIGGKVVGTCGGIRVVSDERPKIDPERQKVVIAREKYETALKRLK